MTPPLDAVSRTEPGSIQAIPDRRADGVERYGTRAETGIRRRARETSTVAERLPSGTRGRVAAILIAAAPA